MVRKMGMLMRTSHAFVPFDLGGGRGYAGQLPEMYCN